MQLWLASGQLGETPEEAGAGQTFILPQIHRRGIQPVNVCVCVYIWGLINVPGLKMTTGNFFPF